MVMVILELLFVTITFITLVYKGKSVKVKDLMSVSLVIVFITFGYGSFKPVEWVLLLLSSTTFVNQIALLENCRWCCGS